MQGTVHGLVYMGVGDYGEDVTRKNGDKVAFVSFYDREAKETVRLTCAPSWDGALPDQEFAPVSVEVIGQIRTDAGVGKDGRAYSKGAKVMLQVAAMKAAK